MIFSFSFKFCIISYIMQQYDFSTIVIETFLDKSSFFQISFIMQQHGFLIIMVCY